MLYRSYFGMEGAMRYKHMRTSPAYQQIPCGALVAYASTFARFIRDFQPKYVIAMFDCGPSFRNELFPLYKQQRPKVPSSLPPTLLIHTLLWWIERWRIVFSISLCSTDFRIYGMHLSTSTRFWSWWSDGFSEWNCHSKVIVVMPCPLITTALLRPPILAPRIAPLSFSRLTKTCSNLCLLESLLSILRPGDLFPISTFEYLSSCFKSCDVAWWHSSKIWSSSWGISPSLSPSPWHLRSFSVTSLLWLVTQRTIFLESKVTILSISPEVHSNRNRTQIRRCSGQPFQISWENLFSVSLLPTLSLSRWLTLRRVDDARQSDSAVVFLHSELKIALKGVRASPLVVTF